MTETDLHRFLKEVGMAYLYNQNCFLVATEVSVSPSRERHGSSLDQHFIIDVCGVGEKYIPLHLREQYEGIGISSEQKYKYNVLRGIEVKVSRSDFKSGFICSGCNYNYLMVPEGLVWSYEVPKGIGIIKVDAENFVAKSYSDPAFRFRFQGLRILRKPKFKQIEPYQIDNAINTIAKRASRELIARVAENLKEARKSLGVTRRINNA